MARWCGPNEDTMVVQMLTHCGVSTTDDAARETTKVVVAAAKIEMLRAP